MEILITIQMQILMRMMLTKKYKYKYKYKKLTKKCVADILGDLVARLRLREVTEFLVQHSFELKEGSVSVSLRKFYSKSGFC